jgi:Archaeal phage integrase
LHLFCPSSSAWQSEGFVSWMASQGKTFWTIKQTKNYAIKYGHILDTGDASELMPLKTKHNVLSALANLAKYQGRYPVFLEIRQRYALKWTSGNNSLQSLQRFFNPRLNLDVILQRIKEMIRLLPRSMARIIKFACLIGLHPSEVVESVRLINNPETFTQNYDPAQQALLHYKFPQQYLLATKKAYLSFVTPQILESVQGLKQVPTYDAIRMKCYHKKLTCDMRFCRKLFASHLRHEGIQPELVDMLQGRVPPSVLTRHYLVPIPTYKEDVLQALESLRSQL